MVTKFDIKVALLLLIVVLQMTYTTWSVFSGRWSDHKQEVMDSLKVEPNHHGNHLNADDDLPFRLPKRNVENRPKFEKLKRPSHPTDSTVNTTISLSNASNIAPSYKNSVRNKLRINSRLNNSDISKQRVSHGNGFVSKDRTQISIFDKQTTPSDGFIFNKAGACAGSPLAVIIICSSTRNTDLRDAIRRTWASHPEPEMKILFLVGRHANASVEDRIVQEDARSDDVIVANFLDTYANLSLKSVNMLRWAMAYCSTAKFLVKTDDDTFLNTPLLLKNLRKTVHHRFIMGNIIALARPVRDPESKWYTPFSAFNRSSYPTYVSGMAYVISGDAVAELYSASRRLPLFWLEDIYVTGLLAAAARVQLIFNGKFDGFKDFIDLCSIREHIVRHRIPPKEMTKLWAVVQTVNHGDCS